jgi:hypothetical protein
MQIPVMSQKLVCRIAFCTQHIKGNTKTNNLGLKCTLFVKLSVSHFKSSKCPSKVPYWHWCPYTLSTFTLSPVTLSRSFWPLVTLSPVTLSHFTLSPNLFVSRSFCSRSLCPRSLCPLHSVLWYMQIRKIVKVMNSCFLYNVYRWENKFQCHMKSCKVIARGHSGGASLFTPICVLTLYKNGNFQSGTVRQKKSFSSNFLCILSVSAFK